MTRRFGVEVEFVGDLPRVMEAFSDAGIALIDRRHTHIGHSDHSWVLKRDGSVNEGGELVSPPLDFDNEDDRESVNSALMCLQSAGARPDPCAGIHVHIEAKHEDGRDMSAREVAAVVRFTYKFEDAIYRIASSGWETIRGGYRSYARPTHESIVRAMQEVHTLEDLQNVWSGNRLSNRVRYGTAVLREQERYNGTNLQSYFDRGTIEFRYFNSSVNPVRVQTYIALCMAIVQDARNGFERKINQHFPLGAMHNGDVTQEKVLMRLQQVFRTTSRDTKICMSTEDWKNLRRIVWKGSKPQEDTFYRGNRAQQVPSWG